MTQSENRTPLFERLRTALEEGIEFAKGNLCLQATAVPEHPPGMQGKAIRQLRHLVGMSQLDFAQILNVSTSTIRSWEQGLRRPSVAALRFLYFLNQKQKAFYNPSGLGERVKQAKEIHARTSRASKLGKRNLKIRAS